VKTFLQYAVLVGVSVLAILGIIHLGQGLRAPASVGGRWALQATQASAADLDCLSFSFAAEPSELSISQSGPELALTFNDSGQTKFTGKLQGLKITARSRRDPELHLVAEVDRQAEPDQLSSTIASEQCAAAIQLTGVRLPHGTSLTGEH
jgi:hypothetical protein